MEKALWDGFRYLLVAALCSGTFAVAKQFARSIGNGFRVCILGLVSIGIFSFQIGYGGSEVIPEPCTDLAQAAEQQLNLTAYAAVDRCVSQCKMQEMVKFFLILGVPFAIGAWVGIKSSRPTPEEN